MNYFERFFEEKKLEYQQWTIKDNKGFIHIIDNISIIDMIKQTIGRERKRIRTMLVKLDFLNKDINRYLKHIATGYILNSH